MSPADFSSSRERLSLTQSALGACLGIDARTVQRYETGALPVPVAISKAVRYELLVAAFRALEIPS